MSGSREQEYPWRLQVFCILLSGALWLAPVLLSSSLAEWFGVEVGLSRGDYVEWEEERGDPILVHRTLWKNGVEVILPIWMIAAILTFGINLIPLKVYRSRRRWSRLAGLCCGRCDAELNFSNVAKYREVFLCDNCARQMEEMEGVKLARFAMIDPERRR